MGTEPGRNQILLIEDNPADVLLVKEALKTHDIQFELKLLSDGEEALDHVNTIVSSDSAPHLILLDLNLPRIDGKRVLSHIRGNPHLATTKVAILTSSDSPHDRRDTADLGADQYIKKPPTLDEFLNVGAIIKELLTRSKT